MTITYSSLAVICLIGLGTLALVALTFYVFVIEPWLSGRDKRKREEPRDDDFAPPYPGPQRQLQLQQTDNLDPTSRTIVRTLNNVIDQFLEYVPFLDRLAALPPAYRQQILTNAMPLMQNYLHNELSRSNDMNLLVNERKLRLAAEIIIARDLLLYLPTYIQARIQILTQLIQAYHALTALAGDDPFIQYIVGVEVKSMMAEFVGAYGYKPDPNAMHKTLYASRQDNRATAPPQPSIPASNAYVPDQNPPEIVIPLAPEEYDQEALLRFLNSLPNQYPPSSQQLPARYR